MNKSFLIDIHSQTNTKNREKRHSLNEILEYYIALESRCDFRRHLDTVSYDTPVNFNESLNAPRHRWFPYKEGFSPSFVNGFFKEYCNPKPNVIDPFSGVGTTVLQSCLNDGHGTGFEVSPLAIFISKAKTTSLSPDELKRAIQILEIFKNSTLKKTSNPPTNPTVISYFEPSYLDALLKVKCFFSDITEESIANLFKLAFLSAIEPFSTHRKAGNGLKRRTRLPYAGYLGTPQSQVKQWIVDRIEIFLADLKFFPLPTSAVFLEKSSIEMDSVLESNSFDCMLTSPPYANCFDYSKIYLCELWLGDFFISPQDQRDFREKSVRSHVHARWGSRHENFGSTIIENMIVPLLKERELWSDQIPVMLSGYFQDIGRMLAGLRRVLRPGASAGIVVSNSVYGGIPIATDIIIAELGKEQGFHPHCIEIFRNIVPSSQQFSCVTDRRWFRESMVVLKNAK